MTNDLNNPYNSPTPPSNPNDSGARNRWTDEDPTTANAVGWLLAFPKAVIIALAQPLLNMTEHQHQQLEDDSSVKSLGADKVMSMYQSRLRRRSSDKEPEVFRFLNRLKALPTNLRNVMIGHTVAMVNGTRLYLKACVDNGVSPKISDIHRITDEYRRGGNNGLNALLAEITTGLHVMPEAPVEPAPAPAEPDPTPAPPPSSGSGMRSRK